jgi:outer membrane protein OmpA-like peptidoglycan-associated protein
MYKKLNNLYFQIFKFSNYFLVVFCTILFLFALPSLLLAQSISPANADCDHPIVIHDSVYGPTNPPIGFGKVMEISSDKNNIYFFEKEHNTVWYKFTTPQTCILSFDIIPEDVKDDYDFILFRYTDKNFCSDLRNKKILPVRSNISRNDPKVNSITGLSKDANLDFVRSGPGEQFSKALDVKKGEIYCLVLDNVYENGKGHTIKLHYSDCSEDSAYSDISKSINVSGEISLKVVDKVTNKPVKSTIDIFKSETKLNKKPLFHFTNKSDCRISIDKKQTYYLQISSKGYLNYTCSIDLRPQTSDLKPLKIELEKIEVGKNFMIENIYFQGNMAKFLPGSNPALSHLLNFMKENPTAKIEIQGHVNFPSTYGKPTREQDEFNRRLSNDRAKAVYDYLVKNHIPPARMTYKGYGDTHMIFPDARLEKEKQQNRRVEIVITEK